MKNFKIGASVILIMALSVVSTNACEIAGSWQHANKPATLSINVKNGLVKIETHQLAPQAIGLTVINSLRLNPDTKNSWLGKMYNAAEDNFIDVVIEAASCQELVVTERHKTILRLLR